MFQQWNISEISSVFLGSSILQSSGKEWLWTFRGVHICVLCNVLSDDGLQKRPKNVAVIIYNKEIVMLYVRK